MEAWPTSLILYNFQQTGEGLFSMSSFTQLLYGNFKPNVFKETSIEKFKRELKRLMLTFPTVPRWQWHRLHWPVWDDVTLAHAQLSL